MSDLSKRALLASFFANNCDTNKVFDTGRSSKSKVSNEEKEATIYKLRLRGFSVSKIVELTEFNQVEVARIIRKFDKRK